jgi:hypothetical protein
MFQHNWLGLESELALCSLNSVMVTVYESVSGKKTVRLYWVSGIHAWSYWDTINKNNNFLTNSSIFQRHRSKKLDIWATRLWAAVLAAPGRVWCNWPRASGILLSASSPSFITPISATERFSGLPYSWLWLCWMIVIHSNFNYLLLSMLYTIYTVWLYSQVKI